MSSCCFQRFIGSRVWFPGMCAALLSLVFFSQALHAQESPQDQQESSATAEPASEKGEAGKESPKKSSTEDSPEPQPAEKQPDFDEDGVPNWYHAGFWTSLDGKPVEESWVFEEGEVRLVQPRGGRGSVISPPMPEYFELTFDWMIGPKANNGLKYRVRQFGSQWLGIEYQMIDEQIPLKQLSKGSTASIYDLVAPTLDKPLKPANEWNQARIVAHGDRIEHWLNGELVAEAKTSGIAWAAIIARSKFYGREGFGESREGDRIMLTDHGGAAAYRNFQFLVLPAPTPSDSPAEQAPQLGNAFRNGWADADSIVLWTRTTARAEMITEGPEFVSIPRNEARELANQTDPEKLLQIQLPEGATLEEMTGACPGAPGQVRLTYYPDRKSHESRTTEWVTTQAEQDFTHQWQLSDLKPDTSYVAILEARPTDSKELTAIVRGGFRTAPAHDKSGSLTFCMTTCHDYARRDDGSNGHKIYPSMKKIGPDFTVHAGDVEYYDHPDPWAWTLDLMRFKWARIFALPNYRDYYANHTTYFIKDDHDTLKDDCWAGQRYGAVTFEEGVQLFNEEQFPSRNPRYATIRWGADLQIWVLEGRDYRSPNNMPDGPDKTILGPEQKAWLKQTLTESDATFKLIFSPTPIVGPDRENKKDNHANKVFAHEGDELRQFFGEIENLIVFCGDRHWQYASEDEENGLWEFGCGPGSETHQFGWKPGDERPEHRFLRVKAGFLTGTLKPASGEDSAPQLVIRHHDVYGKEVSQFEFPRPATAIEAAPATPTDSPNADGPQHKTPQE